MRGSLYYLFGLAWLPFWGLFVTGLAADFQEDFATDPADRGWQAHGDASRFRWDADAGALEVTWDSRRPNSYYALLLPEPLTKEDDFRFGFNLRLDAYEAGIDPLKPGTFQIALGLINLAQATAAGFQRGVFLHSTNLVEWTWFGAAAGISPSISPAIVPADGRLPWGYRDSFVNLDAGSLYGFELTYTAADRRLGLVMTVDGGPGPELQPVILPASFTDFRVDALSINSYSDAGQDPRFAGSVLATGWIDDLTWTLPAPAVGRLRWVTMADVAGVSLMTRTGWNYQLESSTDLRTWAVAGPVVGGTGGEKVLPDTATGDGDERFYRVKATRP